MINGDKLLKSFFSEREINLLGKIGISSNETLNSAYLKLCDYLKDDSNSEKSDDNFNYEEYNNLMEKFYNILPIYYTPSSFEEK